MASVARSKRSPRETADLATVFVLGLAVGVGGQLFNCAAVVHRGAFSASCRRRSCPPTTSSTRAAPSRAAGRGWRSTRGGVPLGDFVFAFDFGTVAVEVCEDAWSPDGPMRRRSYSGAEVVVNVSASPYRMGIDATRREMLATRAADNQTVLLYANAVGGQDGLIYDGGGFVFQNGRRVLRSAALRRRAGGPPWSISIARGACGSRTPPGAPTARRSLLAGNPVRVIRVATGATADRSTLAYPVPEGGSFFLPASRHAATRTRATWRSTTCSRRWRSA